MSNSSVSTLVATNFMRIKLSTSALGFQKGYKQGKSVLARYDGADESSYRVSRSMIPPGYDLEYNALKKAQNATRTVFQAHTLSLGKSADGTKADGDKVIRASKIADGSFFAEWYAAEATFASAHSAFYQAYPSIVDAIERDSAMGKALGSSFDRSEYPIQEEVMAGFAVVLEGPFPIADASNYDLLPLDKDTREALEARYEASQARAVSVMSQSLAADMADYLQVMATNLEKYRDYLKAPNDQRKRAPSIYKSLVTNLTEAMDKARSFAIPETEQGSRLIELVDTVKNQLQPHKLDADIIKSAASSYVDQLARTAKGLADMLTGEDWDA